MITTLADRLNQRVTLLVLLRSLEWMTESGPIFLYNTDPHGKVCRERRIDREPLQCFYEATAWR
jgi:hypothetical protein